MEPSELAPLFALRVRTPRLELRWPVGEELDGLAHLAREGIHPPEQMPFRIAWTDGAGDPDFVERFIAFHEEKRNEWRPERWVLNLGVWAESELAGSQTIEADSFAATRTVSTGSWLGATFQGRGYGTEMRSAVLELAFAGLGAERARSGVIEGNIASERVSMKLGYEPVGEGVISPRGESLRELELELTRAGWQERRWADIAVEALEPCLPLFGLGEI